MRVKPDSAGYVGVSGMIDLNQYLKKTEYCDSDHPEIRSLAAAVTAGHDTDRDKAVALFHWVRDNIIYRVGLWNRKASETLREREGTCTNKSNLLVALLRACRIPAGYGLLKVDGQRYWGPATPRMIAKHVGSVGIHLYTGVFLDRWVRTDPSDDRYLCENIGYINPTATLLDWDGLSDATIPIDPAYIYSDQFPLADIDAMMRKKPRNARGIKLSICNVFIKYLRETRQRFDAPEEVESAFLAYLKIHHPLYYRLLMISSGVKEILLRLQLMRVRGLPSKPLPPEWTAK